jgi:hypothetical protein
MYVLSAPVGGKAPSARRAGSGESGGLAAKSLPIISSARRTSLAAIDQALKRFHADVPLAMAKLGKS